ncbi:MAG TPA: serine/threonine-protein kinase [Gemmatimonadaceae bacterium]|nr:serine/threonine-protein kinase [Gemmatimonadaceae bacterium]
MDASGPDRTDTPGGPPAWPAARGEGAGEGSAHGGLALSGGDTPGGIPGSTSGADTPGGDTPGGGAAPPPAGSAREAAERASLQRALGEQYVVWRLIGRGGMSAVYLVRDRQLGRLVAVKMLPAAGAFADHRSRFRAEARLTAGMVHPNIVPVHAIGETDALMWFTMDFVRGESLAERIARAGRVQVREATRILIDLARALEYAHRRGVIHRDLKPENILLDAESSRALVSDFGIATISGGDSGWNGAWAVAGTPMFMSPEQITGDVYVDARSDIYSLGVVAYLMLSGETPFKASGPQHVAKQHLLHDPEELCDLVPAVPIRLSRIVHRCLEKGRNDRWHSATALREALEERIWTAEVPPRRARWARAIARHIPLLRRHPRRRASDDRRAGEGGSTEREN